MSPYDDKFDPSYDDEGRVTGYSFTGTKGRALYDWQERKEDKDFIKLCDRLRQKKWWRALTDEERDAVYEYRRAWAKAHPKRVRAYMKKAKAKRVRNGKSAAHARKLRKQQRAERIKTIVWICTHCGDEHRPDPAKRIPAVKPKYCSQRCRSKAQHARLTAAETATGSGSLTAHVGYGGRIKLLRGLYGDLTMARLTTELGYSKKYARNTLSDLFAKGHLDRVRRGVYRVKEVT